MKNKKDKEKPLKESLSIEDMCNRLDSEFLEIMKLAAMDQEQKDKDK